MSRSPLGVFGCLAKQILHSLLGGVRVLCLDGREDGAVQRDRLGIIGVGSVRDEIAQQEHGLQHRTELLQQIVVRRRQDRAMKAQVGRGELGRVLGTLEVLQRRVHASELGAPPS
jgi:hypothetical protein